ncbi:MAG: SlyX family protein [Psychromonas sp.]|nr:SlyX family protein [Psychromonas sp.]
MSTQNRIEQLEMKVSFQEDIIETLNDEMFDLQTKFKLLSEKITYLVSKVKEADPDDAGMDGEGRDQVDMRPPHY